MTKSLIRSRLRKNREDHISKLFNEVIINEILYRLPTSKDMIRTGTLSKRWKNLWRSVPKAVFYDYQFLLNQNFESLPYYDVDYSVPQFYKCVNETLSQLHLETLDQFHLVANYDSQFSEIVHQVVDFCSSRNVKRFSLVLRDYEDDCKYWIYPRSFYINKHFTDISLGNCIIYPIFPITWNNLINLSIAESQIDGVLIKNILNGSPLLKSVTFERCNVTLLDIHSTSLENLQLIGFFGEPEDSLTINAPNILSLKIVGTFVVLDIILHDVSSLKMASLDFVIQRNLDTIHKRQQENVLRGVLQRLQHVEHVTIGYSCNKVLSRLDEKGFARPQNLVGVNPIRIHYPKGYDSDISIDTGDDSDDSDDSDIGISDDE